MISATSRPDHLEPALRRSGRFDKEICLSVPDEKARFSILWALCKSKPLSSDIDLKLLAKLTPGYVPSDLEALVREASLFAVERYVELGVTVEKASENKEIERIQEEEEEEEEDGSQGDGENPEEKKSVASGLGGDLILEDLTKEDADKNTEGGMETKVVFINDWKA